MLKTKGKQEIRLDSLDLDWEQKTGNLEDKTWFWIVNARSRSRSRSITNYFY